MSLLSSFEFASLLGSQDLNTWFLGPKLIAQTVPPWHIGHDSCGPPTAPPVPFAQVFVVRGLRGVWSVKGGSCSMFLRSHPPYPWKIPKGPFTNSFCLGISFFAGGLGKSGVSSQGMRASSLNVSRVHNWPSNNIHSLHEVFGCCNWP